MATYIAKPNAWFKEGSLAELLEYYYIDSSGQKYGLFRGTYVVGSCKADDIAKGESIGGYDNFWYNKGYKDGDEVLMNEVCAYEEFEIKEL